MHGNICVKEKGYASTCTDVPVSVSRVHAQSHLLTNRSDDVTCTVCSQDLSKGAIEVEEHPTVRGVAVCPR